MTTSYSGLPELYMFRAPLYALTVALSLMWAIAIVLEDAPQIADDRAEALQAPPLPFDANDLHPPGAEVPSELQREPSALPSTTTSTTILVMVPTPTERPVIRAVAVRAKPIPTTTTTVVATTTTTRAPAPSTTTTATPTTTTTAPPPAPAGHYDSSAESKFTTLINSLRASRGLPALTRNGSLDARARNWSQYMANQGSIGHSDLSSLLPQWSAGAENVGAKGTVTQIFGMLEASPGHLSNMVDNFTHVGVGVWRDADGTLWTTHVFAR